jgi:hypothetical protein
MKQQYFLVAEDEGGTPVVIPCGDNYASDELREEVESWGWTVRTGSALRLTVTQARREAQELKLPPRSKKPDPPAGIVNVPLTCGHTTQLKRGYAQIAVSDSKSVYCLRCRKNVPVRKEGKQ